MEKYLILDFGKVLAYPTTGYWFITPCFMKTLDMEKVNISFLLEKMNQYNFILSRKMVFFLIIPFMIIK